MNKYLFFSLLSLLLYGCSNDEKEADFDKGPILENLADNIILPSYLELDEQIKLMDTQIKSFIMEPSPSTLRSAKDQWLTARLAWKTAEIFKFGPVEDNNLSFKLDLYPISESGLLSAIENYDGTDTYLSLVGSNKIGFGAIEYMLFGLGEETTIGLFNTDNNYSGYLSLLSENLKNISGTLYSEWNSDYAATFKSNTGNDASASITLYTNALIELLESIKNYKVAIPLGLKTDSELPDQVESPYGNYSKELILKNLESIENVYMGASGEGLDDYLNALNIVDGDELLSIAILDKIEACKSNVNAIGILQEAVVNDQAAVEKLFISLQELTTITKSDMMSQLYYLI